MDNWTSFNCQILKGQIIALKRVQIELQKSIIAEKKMKLEFEEKMQVREKDSPESM